MEKLRNRLEPTYLLELFFRYPPEGFQARILPGGLPVFAAQFDLLTTMDTVGRKRIESLPFYRHWSSLLKFNTLFVGTTVSEFAPIPQGIDDAQVAQQLVNEAKGQYSLVIVKDLPQSSVLVGAQDNTANERFSKALEAHGFIGVEGQALAYVPVDYQSIDDFISRFSKNRRKDFRRKLRAMDSLDIEVLHSGNALFFDEAAIDHFYALYEQVYAQSEVHFDRLCKEFFRGLLQTSGDDLRVITYRADGALIGYNICFVVDNMLVDKYIGFDYPAATDHNLYFVSWFYNLEYARKSGLKCYIAGWTDPEIKAYLGAQFAFTRHAVFIRNPLLRAILRRFRHHFESDANWHQQNQPEHIPKSVKRFSDQDVRKNKELEHIPKSVQRFSDQDMHNNKELESNHDTPLNGRDLENRQSNGDAP